VNYGDTVTLRCNARSNIDLKWTQTDTMSGVYVIYSNGSVSDNTKDRFSITSSQPGEYNLMMLGAIWSDAGLYVCDELNQTSGFRTSLSQYHITVPGRTYFFI